MGLLHFICIVVMWEKKIMMKGGVKWKKKIMMRNKGLRKGELRRERDL